MKRKINIIFLIVLCVVFSTSFVCAYSDLSEKHWAYDYVMDMQEKGIMLGYPDGTFRPNKEVTRAELAAMITRVFQPEASDGTIKFDDVEGIHWAENEIALANKFLTGYKLNEKYYFKPDEVALREDITVALVKALRIDNKDVNLNILNEFTDAEDISENLTKYVAIAVEEQLIAGYPNNTFGPMKGINRAEVATLFARVYERAKENQEDEKIVVDDIDKDTNDEDRIKIGDINADEKIDELDQSELFDYLAGAKKLTKEQLQCADIFKDGIINEMDALAFYRYLDNEISIPHTCGSYEENYIDVVGAENHQVEYKCVCRKVKGIMTGDHNFVNGKCICGALESKQENVITWNGDYVSNINGLTKVKLTKISDTEVNFYIKGMTNRGFFGANNNAEIIGNTAKHTYEIFDDKGEIIFRFEGKDLIIETSGCEDLSILAGTYKVDDGSVSEIEWTIAKNPIEGEYLLGEEMETPNVGSLEELEAFLQSAPDSITLTVSDVEADSATFSIGGIVDGGMFAIGGSLEKVEDKWKYFDKVEEKYIIEIAFEEGKAIVTGLGEDNEKLSGAYTKQATKNEYEKYENMIDESSVGEGVYVL